jgi:two-component system LytT family response regulator
MALHDPSVAPILTLVVDDEPLARRNLAVLLQQDPDVGAIVECGSGIEAVAMIRERRPDLLFLDVQMPECDGFEVLERLGTDLPPTIVFVTAHDSYTLKAFEAGALDYLLKPFDDARFARAMNRAKDNIARFRSPPPPAARLAVRSSNRLLFLDVSQIEWIEAASYYACLHVGRDTHILRRTLSDLERDLDRQDFLRIHRSTIINLRCVRGLELQSSGEYWVVLDSDVRLRISRRYRRELYDRLGLSRDAEALKA